MSEKEKSTKKLPKVPEVETLAELKAWAEKLEPKVRNALVKEITEATDRIVNKTIGL